MRKSKTMRAAVLLLALVLITSCFVGGTFAKYITTADGGDSARVAKWGVTLEVGNSGDTSGFKTSYNTDDSTYSSTITTSVSSENAVVAPGTKSDANGISFKISGTPEVATKVTISMTNMEEIFLGTGDTAYYPVTFKLERKSTSDNNWSKVAEGKLSNIQTALTTANSVNQFAPGVKLDNEYRLTWEWPFGSTTNDVNDTALGNLMAGKTVSGYGTDGTDYNLEIKYNISFTVEQID